MSRPERLIAAGLAAAAVAGTASALLLWQAGRLHSSDWPYQPALLHPVLLASGIATGALALGLGAVCLGVLVVRYRGWAVASAFGVILLVPACLGGFGLLALDAALIGETKGPTGVGKGFIFTQKWDSENLVAWSSLVLGGAAALISVGIGLAQARPSLQRPGAALAIAGVFIVPVPQIGAPLVALSLFWIALAVVRLGRPAPGASEPDATPVPV